MTSSFQKLKHFRNGRIQKCEENNFLGGGEETEKPDQRGRTE